MGRFLLPLSEYNRIYQVAHGVLRDVGTAEKACMFFAAFGALILNKHYKIPARAVAGAFALCLNDKPMVVSFADRGGRSITSSADGYHMWVQTQTHIIDFMAPIFSESFAVDHAGLVVPRKMLQRPISTEAQSTDDLVKAGDFITFPNPELTAERVDRLFQQPANADLLRVADTWFGSRRSKQQKSFTMRDDLGEVFKLALPTTTAVGSW